MCGANPITALRRRYDLTQDRLGAILGLPVRVVRTLEMSGRQAPAQALEFMERQIIEWLADPPVIELPAPEALEQLRLFGDAEVAHE